MCKWLCYNDPALLKNAILRLQQSVKRFDSNTKNRGDSMRNKEMESVILSNQLNNAFISLSCKHENTVNESAYFNYTYTQAFQERL